MDDEKLAREIQAKLVKDHGEECWIAPGFGAGDDMVDEIITLIARVRADERERRGTVRQDFPLSHEACDAFWQYWKENGETHKHGYYESTWGAIRAYMIAAKASDAAIRSRHVE